MPKVALQRVRLNAGGYEYGKFGKYWGVGLPLYRAEFNNGLEDVVQYHRAPNREAAKQLIRDHYPLATFYN